MQAANAALLCLLAFEGQTSAARIQDLIYHLNDMLALIFSEDSLSGTADHAILYFMSQLESAAEFIANYMAEAVPVPAHIAASHYSATRRSVKRVVREFETFENLPPPGIPATWWSEFGTVANEALIFLNDALELPATREMDVEILYSALDYIYNNTTNAALLADAAFGKTLLRDCMGPDPLSTKHGFYGIIQTVRGYIERFEAQMLAQTLAQT